MSSIMPEGETLRKAVKWISRMREEGKTPLPKLIEDAGVRFDLAPKDEEFLERFFLEGKDVKK